MDDLYEREAIGISIVLIYPSESWVVTPVIYEGDNDDKENTKE